MEEGKKFLGACIDSNLYWDIRRKLVEKQETITQGMVYALCKYLGLEVTNYVLPFGPDSGSNEAEQTEEPSKV